MQGLLFVPSLRLLLLYQSVDGEGDRKKVTGL